MNILTENIEAVAFIPFMKLYCLSLIVSSPLYLPSTSTSLHQTFMLGLIFSISVITTYSIFLYVMVCYALMLFLSAIFPEVEVFVASLGPLMDDRQPVVAHAGFCKWRLLRLIPPSGARRCTRCRRRITSQHVGIGRR